MSEKVMFYDGLFDKLAEEYTSHKSKRIKIGVVMTKKELNAIKTRETQLLKALKEKEAENERLKDIRNPLIEAFEAFIDQYGCDCGHPWCKPCADTTEALTAIKYAEICVAQAEAIQEPPQTESEQIKDFDTYMGKQAIQGDE